LKDYKMIPTIRQFYRIQLPSPKTQYLVSLEASNKYGTIRTTARNITNAPDGK